MHRLREHYTLEIDIPEIRVTVPAIVFRKRRADGECALFSYEGQKLKISSTYYIGADWIPGNKSKHWFMVEPKLNPKHDPETSEPLAISKEEETQLKRVDVSKMLFDALSHPEVHEHTDELFEIKFESPSISLPKQDDLLSPLLIIRFLKVVKEIVRKGLKKSYYKINQNLYGKVKGKVLVGQTVKQNHAKNKDLHTYCRFEEFGDNGIENRLIKKTLLFVQRYLNTFQGLNEQKFFQQTMDFIQPAFSQVSPDVELHNIKHVKFNAFYKDYNEAIRLAKMILRRFGYNIQAIKNQSTIDTPPYWIDMSKLFELYVLGKLKESPYGKDIIFHQRTYGNELDFLYKANDDSVVLDAKYKPYFKDSVNHQDIRQISGYSRLRRIREKAGVSDETMLDCVIIYPDLESENKDITKLPGEPIKEYEKVWKIGLALPSLSPKKNDY
ncbi:hypothetical protein EF405_19080 [Cyclobacteriaceae bacterium YHN15]|nr:hypothetical protein EF405_19080 [Cyclobacteriaceae bacterium YHN15]